MRHLREKKVPVTSDFALQETLLNEAWSTDTPLLIRTEILGEGSYRMSVLPRPGKDAPGPSSPSQETRRA